MILVEQFTFGPFQENTFLLIAENGDCLLIDPGCATREEDKQLAEYIKGQGLNLTDVWLTHCHIDHVLGCHAFCDEDFLPKAHALDAPLFEMAERSGQMYGIPYTPGPTPDYCLEHGQKLDFAGHTFEVRFTPGHAPGHVVFVHHQQRFVIGGDVLFKGSVGRIDLPGGDGPTLAKSIKEQLYTLPDDFKVHPGHGPATMVGYEKEHNAMVEALESGLL